MDDDILRLAREAGLSHVYDSEQDFSGVTDALLVDADKQRNDKRLVEILGPLVALVRADEREACAKVCEELPTQRNFYVRHLCAAAIRARGQSSVDRAVNRMAEQAMLGVWQDVPGAVNFGITDPAAPRCRYPDCVGGQSGTVCHKHCPTPCPDCRGLGYDASGQLCGCQGNPSF